MNATKNLEKQESLIVMRHIVEFDRISKADCKKLLRWCKSCCFQHWHTHTNELGFAFIFESKFDAELFIMTHSEYFGHDIERY